MDSLKSRQRTYSSWMPEQFPPSEDSWIKPQKQLPVTTSVIMFCFSQSFSVNFLFSFPFLLPFAQKRAILLNHILIWFNLLIIVIPIFLTFNWHNTRLSSIICIDFQQRKMIFCCATIFFAQKKTELNIFLI